MKAYEITWSDPTGESTMERWTSTHMFESVEAAGRWAVEAANGHKQPVRVRPVCDDDPMSDGYWLRHADTRIAELEYAIKRAEWYLAMDPANVSQAVAILRGTGATWAEAVA